MRQSIDLILYKSWADLRSEARKYYLSYLWWVLEPIFEMAIFYLVFDVLMRRGGSHFVQFLLIGLVSWKWFGTTVNHCGESILAAKGLIQQAAIPKLVFPTTVICTDTFKAFIAMIMVEVFLLSSGFYPNIAYLAIPILFVVQLLLITAMGFTLSAITPYFPDLSIIVSLLLRGLFFLSGVFFDPQGIPEQYRSMFFLNPMARLINDYRGILLHQRIPQPEPLLAIGFVAILVIAFAISFFSRHETAYPRVVAK